MDEKKMRLGLYRKIEIARKQLPDMDEEAFRDRLRNEYGISSRKDMSVASCPMRFGLLYGFRSAGVWLGADRPVWYLPIGGNFPA